MICLNTYEQLTKRIILISPEIYLLMKTIVPFEKIKEEAIRHALKVTKGNIVEAAKRLQLGRATIYRLMEKYSIENRTYE